MPRFFSLHKRLTVSLAVILLAVTGVGLAIFKPWLLFIDETVNDEIPTFSTAAAPPAQSSASAGPESTAGATEEPAQQGPAQQEPAQQGPVQVASGSFVSHEHSTTGTARILRNPDGSHQLVLENLATSNGPDVRVWLSAGPVIEGKAGWFTAGDYKHLDVAPIKGNLGNQVYNLPAGTDLSEWKSVVLWCDDFNVSFGAAELSAS
ncbi:DM13 domain-containing protein [Actinomyces sp. zg296]|uniref:DM13 domain-containing protein n=1 Tax=Actinomyces sp. zg296 TaxID=2609289 RepID=UPI00135B199D|nr:DM13 domain-containing protein [Actinomyces sp. zg296]